MLEYTLHPFFVSFTFQGVLLPYEQILSNYIETILGQMAELWFVRLNKKHVALFVGFIYTCCTLFSNSLTFQKHNCLWAHLSKVQEYTQGNTHSQFCS